MLTKLVNGKRITLTPQEEADRIAEWDANKLKHDAERAVREADEKYIDDELAKPGGNPFAILKKLREIGKI